MKQYQDILPRDKSDQERVDQISTLNLREKQELIPYLVEWIQDINWPISFNVIELLLNHPDETIPHIKKVLLTNDGDWKANCIYYFIRKLPDRYKFQFINELEKIVQNPTIDEKYSEVDEIARDLLKEIKKGK
jgi:hypothetical protein